MHELWEKAPRGRFALHLRGAEREFQHAAAAVFSGAAAVLRAAARAPGHAGTRDVKTVCVVKAVFHFTSPIGYLSNGTFCAQKYYNGFGRNVKSSHKAVAKYKGCAIIYSWVF